jgi:hypothetical protein
MFPVFCHPGGGDRSRRHRQSDNQPQRYFMHFLANAKKLAEGLKAAPAQINIAKS